MVAREVYAYQMGGQSPVTSRSESQNGEARDAGADDGDLGTETGQMSLSKEVPVLSASARRAGAHLDDADWTGRTVTVERVLGRWFRYRRGDWAQDVQEHT